MAVIMLITYYVPSTYHQPIHMGIILDSMYSSVILIHIMYVDTGYLGLQGVK